MQENPSKPEVHMPTQQDQLEGRSGEATERREFTRYEAPDDVYVTVELPGGDIQARVMNTSPFGGACLIFDEDPRLRVGMTIPVSCGDSSVIGDVQHVAEVCGKYRVGVRWNYELP